jgi:hypothetical protein
MTPERVCVSCAAAPRTEYTGETHRDVVRASHRGPVLWRLHAQAEAVILWGSRCDTTYVISSYFV